ncbi:MAG: LEA type 2 family protein [Treponema sp.]|jgi:LEA14-like dessication related protein|nr:LEA type 2 family protein [Treponema sp.]
MKKIIPALVLSFLLVSCASLQEVFKEPEFSFDSFKISKINFDSIDLLFTYKIDNPNLFGITLPRFAYNLFIEDASFISGTSAEPIQIDRQASHFVDIPVTLLYEDLVKSISILADQNEAAYQIDTDFFLEVPVIGERNIPLSHSGKIPILKLPEISLNEVKSVSTNPLSPAVELSVNIINKNIFAISPDTFNFAVLLNDKQITESSQNNIAPLEPGKSSTVTIPVKLNPITLGTQIISAIIGGRDIDVNLNGNFTFDTDYESIGKIDLPFDLKKILSVKNSL